MNIIIKKLALASGMDAELLKTVSHHSVWSRAILGGLLYLAITFIAAGMANVANIVFNNTIITLGFFILIWGLMYFFDLSLILAIDKMVKKTGKKLLMVFVMRLIIIIPLSYISSTTILMRLYNQEIQNTIVLNNLEKDKVIQHEIAIKIDSINTVKKTINDSVSVAYGIFNNKMKNREDKLNTTRKRLQKKSDQLVLEIEGKLQRKAGNGAAAKAKRAQIIKETEVLNQEQEQFLERKNNGPEKKDLEQKLSNYKERLSVLDNLIKESTERKESVINVNKITATDGYQDRYLALEQIRNDGKSWMIMMAILFAMMAIELLPLLVKLFQALEGNSEYEKRLHEKLYASNIAAVNNFKAMTKEDEEEKADTDEEKRLKDAILKKIIVDNILDEQDLDNQRIEKVIGKIKKFQELQKEIEKLGRVKGSKKMITHILTPFKRFF